MSPHFQKWKARCSMHSLPLRESGFSTPCPLLFFFTCFCVRLGLRGRVVVMLGLQAHTSCWKAGHPCSEAAHPWRFCCVPCSAMRGPSSLLIPNHSPCLSNFSYQLTFSLLLFRPTFVGLPKGKASTEINYYIENTTL